MIKEHGMLNIDDQVTILLIPILLTMKHACAAWKCVHTLFVETPVSRCEQIYLESDIAHCVLQMAQLPHCQEEQKRSIVLV